MITLLILTLFLVLSFILCYMNIKTTSIHNRLIEKFENELHMDLSEDDKQLYYTIIDTYELLLDRDPTEDELNFDFDQIKTNKSTLVDLHNKLKGTMEYKRLNDVQFNSAIAPTDANNDVQDYQLVSTVLKETMPLDETERDPLYLDYLVLKYRSLGKDKSKFTNYIKKTPEYNDYKEILVDKKSPTPDDHEDTTTVSVDSQTYSISRPEIGNTTSKIIEGSQTVVRTILNMKNDDIPENEKSCEFYNQYKELQSSKQLADYQNKRNLEELKYHCEMSDTYANVDSNNLLLPNQQWSVPQKHPPVCGDQNCTVNESLTQTGLIGTLLDDVANNSKLLPSFEYKEVEQ